MKTRTFWRIVCAIFALIAPCVIPHPFGLVAGLVIFAVLLLPQRTVSDEILQALSEGKIKVRWD